MKEIEDNIGRLVDSAECFHTAETEEITGRGKKEKEKIIGRVESLTEGLSEFGQGQNEYNKSTAELFKSLLEYCKKLERSIESEREACRRTASALSAVKKEFDSVKLRSTLNSNQIEKLDSAFEKSSERTENFILETNPGFRNEMRPKGCREADLSASHGFYERIEAVRKAASPEDKKDLLQRLEASCMRTASRGFSTLEAYDEISISFYGGGPLADVFYENLLKRSIYSVNRGTDDGKCFVCCSETIGFPESVSFKSGIAVLSGEDPLSGLSERDIENLLFLNDCGLHEYAVFSPDAYRSMKKAGFRSVRLIKPEYLSGREMISVIENIVENAVPDGAVSYDLFCEKSLATVGITGVSFEGMRETYGEGLGGDPTFEEECLGAACRGVVSAVCTSSFPGETIRQEDLLSAEDGKYHLLKGFGYVNHLKYSERKKLYEWAKEKLIDDGMMIFGAANARTGIKLRALFDWGGYERYEAMWTKNQLIRELEENGFRLCCLVPVGAGVYSRLPAKYKSEPVMWIVGVTPV